MAWQKGESGNPAGRRPHPIAERFRKAAEADLDAIVAAIVEAAKMGDVAAAKLLLERVIPPFKSIPQPTPFAMEGNSLTEKAQAVLAAVADGAMAAVDGKALIDAIGSLARLTEIDDLARRVAVLEVKHD